MSFAQDFKSFISRGNVVDLAVAVVIGGAFGKVVSSLVSDIIMPPLGFLLSGVDFTKMKVVLQDATATHKEVAITYGAFINEVIAFLIIALAIFIVIKALEKAHLKAEAAPAPTPPEVALLTEIRDLLKAQPPR